MCDEYNDIHIIRSICTQYGKVTDTYMSYVIHIPPRTRDVRCEMTGRTPGANLTFTGFPKISWQ